MALPPFSNIPSFWLVLLVLILLSIETSSRATKKSENDVMLEYKELEDLVHALEEAVEQEKVGIEQKSKDDDIGTIEGRGLKDTLLKNVAGLKATYKSKSFLPQTPVDFLRYGSIAAEVANSPSGGATLGIFTGAATCLNVFCAPLSLLHLIILGLSSVEDLITGTSEAIETANDDVLKNLNSVPWVGSATKVVSKFLDTSVEPVMGTLEVKTKAVTKPIGFAYNITLRVTNMCIDIKTAMMSVNLLAWIKDLENGNTKIRDDLMSVSDYMKEECGAILEKLPTIGNIVNALIAAGVDVAKDVDGEELLNTVANEVKVQASPFNAGSKREEVSVESRAVPSGPDALADHDPINISLKKIFTAVNAAKDQMKVFEPIISFFDVIRSVVDKVLDFELRIPIGPYGPLLGLALQIGEELVSGMVDAVDKLKSGDVVGAAHELADTVGNVGNIAEQQINAIGGLAEDAAKDVYDGLVSVGTDVADWMDGAGSQVKDGFSKAGDAFSDAWDSGTEAVSDFFSGWKRKRRHLEAQYLLEQQSPNYEYYRSLNTSLVRSARGFDPSSITKLGDYICGFFICVTPREVLQFGRALIDTLLKPFEIAVTEGLKPVLDALKAMFAGVFPKLGFLDDLTGLSITMVPVSDFTKLINIFQSNDLFAYVLASAPGSLGSECMMMIRGYVTTVPSYTAAQVKCACVEKKANCGKKKRSVDEDLEERGLVSHPSGCRYSGIPYQGKLTKTTSGKICTAWKGHSHSGSSFPEKSLAMAKNYCRNPDGKRSPWCYIGGQGSEWEYCSVPLCKPACIASGTSETDGKWSITGSGMKCQPWAAKIPHDLSVSDSDFPENSVTKAEDFCHNPTGQKYGPYCLTTSYGIFMDVCDIPYCNGDSEVMSGFKEYMNGDCPGNDVKHMTSIHLKDCLRQCDSLSNCRAVGHSPSTKQCWLKSQCDRVNNWHTTNMNAYIKSEATEYEEFTNQKCGGNDIWSGPKKVDSVRECREMCDLEPRCLAFEVSGTNCFIKHTCEGKSGDSGVRTFVRENKKYSKYSDRDCPYHDIGMDSGVYSPGECEARCNNHATCGAFTMDHTNGNCHLKTRCRETELVLKAADDTYILKYATDYERYMDKDCPGNDIQWLSAISPKLCEEHCSKDTLCVAFGILLPDNCWLKHTCDPTALSNSNIDIHIKKDVMYFHRNNFQDCFGNDYSYMEAPLEKCATTCKKNSVCKAFHYHPISAIKGKCWLKSKCDTSINSGGHQFIQKETIGFERYRDNDCAGNDISHTSQATADLCARKCKGDAKCYGMTYRPASKDCWIKSECKLSHFTKNVGADSYIETEINGFKLYKNMDCYGNDISKINVNGIRECASLCFKMYGCVAFGLRIGDFECWLKRRCITSEFLNVPTMYSYILQDTSRSHVVEVAHKRPTTQSSIFNVGYSWKAVDGNSGSDYVKHGAAETYVSTNPWWSVTMDSVLTVQYLTIVNRGDCCSNLLHDFDVLLTSDAANPYLSSNPKICKHRSGTVGSGATDIVKCKAPTTGKNVIIRITGQHQGVTLPEVKVYASTPVYKTACEGTEMTIQCPVGDFIQIVTAMYGRTQNENKCPASFATGYSQNCWGASSTLVTVRQACDGTNRCSLPATNSKFGDPCPGNYKYLEVAYNCVHKYQTACEGSTMTLQCSSGKSIEMISANFGRKNTEDAVCKLPGGGSPVTNNNCYDADSLSKVAKLCEGKHSCSVQATTAMFSDPCQGTFKYLEVAYNCK